MIDIIIVITFIYVVWSFELDERERIDRKWAKRERERFQFENSPIELSLFQLKNKKN